MIPALAGKKKAVSIIMGFGKKPDKEIKKEDYDKDESLKAIASDFLKAVESKDEGALASAFRAAFDCISAEEPGEE